MCTLLIYINYSFWKFNSFFIFWADYITLIIQVFLSVSACRLVYTQWSRLHVYVCGLHTEQLVSHWTLQINGYRSMNGLVLWNNHPVQALHIFCQTARKEVHMHKFPFTPPCFPFSKHTIFSYNIASLYSHTHMCMHTYTHWIIWWIQPVLEWNSFHYSVRQTNEGKKDSKEKSRKEKRIWEKWEAQWDKSWQERREKRGGTENKRENKMPNFAKEDLEHCLQNQVSCVCNCSAVKFAPFLIKIIFLHICHT